MMPQISPKFSFWLGVVVTIATAVGGGTLELTNAIPDQYIPAVQAWNNIVAVVGSAVLTALHGFSSAQSGPLTGEEKK